MKQYILVMFVGSLMSSDYDLLNEFDNFKYIISKGSTVKKVCNQYPNLRSPATVSLLTGEFPYNHGIYFDNFNVRVRKYRRKLYEDIRVPTLLDCFEKSGNKIGVISLPVMEQSGFKYNFSKINSVRFRDILRSISYGSTSYMIKNMFKYSDILKINIQPENDNFSSILAMELLEERKSNVVFMELDHLSYVRERYSESSKEHTFGALKSLDKKIGDLISWCDNKNILNSLTMCIVSGGGVYDHKKSININYAFLKNGFLISDKFGRIKKYTAYAHCNGGSAFVYLKNPNNISDYGRVRVFLDEFIRENSEFICGIYESHNYNSLDLNNFSFIIEGKPGCIFDGETNKKDFVEDIDVFSYPLNSKINKSFYGYSGKYENSNGMFISYGNRIRENVFIDKCSIIDIAPTIASFMDLSFKSSGKIIEGIKK